MPPEALALLLVAYNDRDDLGEAVPGGVARLGDAVVGVKEKRDQRRVHVLREGRPVPLPRGVLGQLTEGADGRGAVPLPPAVEERANLNFAAFEHNSVFGTGKSLFGSRLLFTLLTAGNCFMAKRERKGCSNLGRYLPHDAFDVGLGDDVFLQ